MSTKHLATEINQIVTDFRLSLQVKFFVERIGWTWTCDKNKVSCSKTAFDSPWMCIFFISLDSNVKNLC